jgi:hypothetical protein
VLNLSSLGLFPKLFGQDVTKVFKQKYYGKCARLFYLILSLVFVHSAECFSHQCRKLDSGTTLYYNANLWTQGISESNGSRYGYVRT